MIKMNVLNLVMKQKEINMNIIMYAIMNVLRIL